jgi:heme/copper-type cytochrome/quinol oxidase subunit 3
VRRTSGHTRDAGGERTHSAAWIASTVWGVVALQVALVALGGILEWLSRASTSSATFGFAVERAASAASVLAFPAVGAFVFWRRPDHPMGRLFCLVNLGWAVNNFAGSYAKYALVDNPGSLPLGKAVAWFYTWPGPISVGLTVVLLLLFPDGAFLSRRWRLFGRIVALLSVASALALAFAPGPIDETIGFRIENPLGLAGPVGRVLTPLGGITQLTLVGFMAAGAASLLVRFWRSRGDERQQIKWFVSTVVFVIAFIGLQLALYARYGSAPGAMPGWAYLLVTFSILSVGLIPVAAGVAILRYRLYEIDVVINRALVYGPLTAALVGLYFGSVVALQRAFVSLTGERSTLAVVASTLLIAAMFNPLRRRIQSFIDRRFYRRKYDAAKILTAFSARLREETDLGTLADDLVGVVGETVQPAHVSLWLRPQTAPQQAQED